YINDMPWSEVVDQYNDMGRVTKQELMDFAKKHYNNMGQNIQPITKNLIIINVLFFLATFVFRTKGVDLSVILGAFYPESPNFKPWQVLTYMFMHADFTHILFNMFSLWMFGSVVEQTFGPKKFLILYFLM
ncbi:MAG: rhomboid family intramembrane serine protease, partial [Bacilli bacterium]